MHMTPFYGRKEELSRLCSLLKKETASLVVIKGRRRIGKSRLILEFGKMMKTLIFTGLPPTEKTTQQTEREDFVQQMKRLLQIDCPSEDWGDIFWTLSQTVQVERVLLVFDEINWMGCLDHTFLGKLKSAWDLYFKNNPKLVMILSGSMSTWIEKNILSSTGFMGRISLELTLDELPLSVCNLFWRKKTQFVSAYDKFKILSVLGGIPRYLEEIDPDLSAEENIYNLAFRKGGLLVEEFDRIFSDLFSSRYMRYKQIVKRLVKSNATLEQICYTTNLEKSGVISSYLEDLIETGYVSKDYTWNIKNNKESNMCTFRLKDNYLRFYIKYIEPVRNKIKNNRIIALPSWSSIMGLQFENLVIHNFAALYQSLDINPDEIIYDNPFFQRATSSHRGCQIDYLIQTKFNTLYVCEIKFSKDPIGVSVIREVKKKIDRLVKPKNFSIRPILIHVNDVVDSVKEKDFFAKIIDFGQFLYRQ